MSDPQKYNHALSDMVCACCKEIIELMELNNLSVIDFDDFNNHPAVSFYDDKSDNTSYEVVKSIELRHEKDGTLWVDVIGYEDWEGNFDCHCPNYICWSDMSDIYRAVVESIDEINKKGKDETRD